MIRQTKDFFYASLSRLVVIGAQLVVVKLYSNYVDTHELGIYFFLTTLSYSLNAFLFVPIDYYQQARLYHYKKAGISLRSLVVFNRKCLAVAGAITLLLFAALLPVSSVYSIYAILAGTLAIVLYIGGALKGVLNNLENRSLVATVMAIEAVLKVVVLFTFMMWLPRKGVSILAAITVALAISLIPLMIALRRMPLFQKGRVEEVNAAEVVRFSYPMAIGAVANWVQLQGYRMILVPAGFANMVGIYATVSGIGSAGMAAASAIYGQLYLPRIYKSTGSYTRTYVRNAIILTVGILVFGGLLSKIIVGVATKREFVAYSLLILYGIAAEAGNLIIGALSVHLTLTGSTLKNLSASTIALAATAICFLVMYFLRCISVYTVGLPIICSQVMVALYLYYVHDKSGERYIAI